MKILYIHQHFTTPSGSAGIRSYAMAQALTAKGHDVTILCGGNALAATGLEGEFINGVREGCVDGLRVVELAFPYSNHLSLGRRAATFLRFAWRASKAGLADKYDLVIATSTPLTVAFPALIVKALRGTPYVFEVRDLWPELPRAMGLLTSRFTYYALAALEWIAYRWASRCVGLAPGIVEGIHKRGVPIKRIAMIPNGCDIEIFQHACEDRRMDPGAQAPLTAIFTGAHGLANGLDAVLDGAAVLQARGRDDIKIILVGDGKLKPDLQRAAQDLKLQNIEFLEPVIKTKLARLLADADVGLQILANVPEFYYGTSPNKFFDYLAAGLPVLCNYPGWVSDMLRREACGFTPAPGDAGAFADALEFAADNKAELREMGSRALALGRANFCREALADEFCRFVTLQEASTR